MKIEIKSEELKKRLYALLSAPLWGFRETVDAFAKACPREVADEQVNPDQLVGNEEFWTTIVNPELVKRRVGMVKYLEKLEESGQAVVWDGKGKGRGIVMTGGNQDTTARLLVTLRILRKEYKTSLPVEIFSFPGEIQDEALLKELEELNAVVKELPGRTKLNIWKNFQIKADAIVSSSFEEVLYLDSDNVPTRDPTYLFNADIYKKNGKAVFWPDLNKDHPDNPIWRLLGKPCDYSQWEIESGQIIISKSGNDGLNLAALHLASHMQEQHEFYFRLSGGDKDTFRYAFWALRLPFGVSPRYLSALGFKSQYDNGRFCGIAMLQYDLIDPPEAQATSHPTPLFVHGNLLKHMNLLPSGGGSPFSVIKRFSTDVAKSRELDGAKMYVYNVHGMCIDLELLGEAAVEKGGKGLKIVEEAFEEVYGGLLKRFSEIYYKHGGKGGGWR
ncbi:mannosyltransferase putative-domain-containing protein [Cantharellus anzutake]|uniref:mannosyltransferase putative-domain-containing protein n=1 Tax=Cantharellus anzutake TaxID=1750568 RepID=UPI00190801C9|nr:mannosyltransferase putative-domain-containing protein [Cantharellus anzutake]KAF8328664.1 mannosyltransferase putative-domain-containing protein [Cantharellus anzutake]